MCSERWVENTPLALTVLIKITHETQKWQRTDFNMCSLWNFAIAFWNVAPFDKFAFLSAVKIYLAMKGEGIHHTCLYETNVLL